jgi:pimeloyl-ACP methyl ester carboxylesterase
MDIFIIIVSIFIAINLIGYLGACYYTYRVTYKAKRYKGGVDYYRNIDKGGYAPYTDKVRAMLDTLLALPYEDVYVESFDGLRLHARLYRAEAADAPVEIMFHGYKSSSVRDFCFGAVHAIRAGHTVLLVDQRSHSESEGRCIGFGVLERRDVATWVNYVIENINRGARIILYGISMGAATVLSSLSVGLADNVVGIIADCPFSSGREIIYKVSGEIGVSRAMMRIMLGFTTRMFCGFSIDAATAKGSVVGAKIPIMLIHTKEDSLVPFGMSEQIYGANPDIRFEVFEKGDHALAYLADTERYSALLDDFTKKILEGDDK